MMPRGSYNDPFMDNFMDNGMRRHMQHMENMMNSVMADPFGMMGPTMMFGHNQQGGSDPRRQMMIDDGRRHGGQQQQQMQQYDPFNPMMMMPFGGGGGLFGGMLGGMMQQMNQMQNMAMNDPNAHVYTHSTVINYDGTGEQPRVYQKTSEVRKAGRAKETRETIRDSATGEERMKIGHHLDDKSHVIEKKRVRGGHIEEHQQFVGIDERDAPDFDRHFSSASNGRRNLPQHSIGYHQDIPITRTNGSRRYQDEPNGPIIEEPDDDDVPQPKTTNDNKKRGRFGGFF